jgi:hypothetical protein
MSFHIDFNRIITAEAQRSQSQIIILFSVERTENKNDLPAATKIDFKLTPVAGVYSFSPSQRKGIR